MGLLLIIASFLLLLSRAQYRWEAFLRYVTAGGRDYEVLGVQLSGRGFLWRSPGFLFTVAVPYELVPRSKVPIRSVGSPMGRRCIQFCDGVLQSRLALRVAACDRHRYIDARRVRRCNRVTPDQGGLDEFATRRYKAALGPQ